MKNILILIGIFISIFLFSNKAEAASLTLTADKNSIKVGEYSTITATTEPHLAVVSFNQNPAAGGSFSPVSCKTTYVGTTSLTCSVKFYPTVAGAYTISGTIVVNGQIIQSNSSTNPKIAVFEKSTTTLTPLPTGAASLNLTADKNNIKVGEYSTIKATSSNAGTVSFKQFPTTGGSFIPATAMCTTVKVGISLPTCSVQFHPAVDGTYVISGTMVVNTQTVASALLVDPRITVKSTAFSPSLPALFSTQLPVGIAPGATTKSNSVVYTLLAPLPGLSCIGPEGSKDENGNECAKGGIGDYLNILFMLAIGICGVLAVIMIVIGGIQYMGDESVFGKTEAKGRITSAILGLLIALGAFALLNTIDPALTGKDGVTVDQVSAEIAGDSNAPIGTITGLPSGTLCIKGKENIPVMTQSFSGKMTYEMGAKGVPGPNNTIKFDCSGFVNYILRCAGVPFTQGGTFNIFANAEKVTSINGTLVNNIQLGNGDLVGWRPDEDPKRPKGSDFGHVLIYVGNGKLQLVSDSRGPGGIVGKALKTEPITKYGDRIKYIKRAK